MNLAWEEFKSNIIHDKIKLKTNDKKSIETLNNFNDFLIPQNVLDTDSYYVKSWYWKETVDLINKESKEKFPDKSFQDLPNNIWPKDTITYAYFYKLLDYIEPFSPDKYFEFNWTPVKWFYYSKSKNDNKNIKIIKYESDYKFIVKLILKDENDELILAKWYENENIKELLSQINKNDTKDLKSIDKEDEFAAPVLNLNYHRNYDSLVSKEITNTLFKDYFIWKMYENIKFQMDENWVKVENEAVMLMFAWSKYEEPPKHKKFILDKPYWVVMKKITSPVPYFILWVNNSELMELNN
jgi:hypothetical protein